MRGHRNDLNRKMQKLPIKDLIELYNYILTENARDMIQITLKMRAGDKITKVSLDQFLQDSVDCEIVGRYVRKHFKSLKNRRKQDEVR
jgi:hypothetical protein